ncbi:MAG: sulfotransferase domain-containing protein [Paracoccaceae bacterium]
MKSVIWISTPPRTGSMWTYNVTRELMRRVGRDVEPEEAPHEEEESFRLAVQEGFENTDPNRVWVLKVHKALTANMPSSKIITVHRDPRDAVVSFMSFMNVGFDQAKSLAKNFAKYTELYQHYDDTLLHMLRYEDIVNRPEAVIGEIASFTDVPCSDALAAAIAEKFSRKKVQTLTQQIDQELESKLRDGVNPEPQEIVRITDTNYRARDAQTGFQTGHVSGRKTGDWKTILTKAQQDELTRGLEDWLIRYGYEV